MNIIQEFDTITAIATPIGTGGVGVIRISGEKSFEIVEKLFSQKLTAGKIHHGWLYDGDKKIDEVIVLPFENPNSYTGEDVVEIQCHGGVNVVRNILDLVLKNGARMAERGEFTKRAFLNHKLDLSQAEAVCDLIHAKTQNFAIQSAKNLSGVLAEKVKEIKKDIFEVLSKIIAGIDFPEDVKEPEYASLQLEFEKSIKKIDGILACAKSSNVLRQGIKVAILGKPNVGKSSLFNALLSLNRAIVTDIAGTTRDVLTETVDIDGIPVTLIDTAGIRESSQIGKVEEIGIEFSKQSAEDADLILFLYDASTGMNKDDKIILDLIGDKKHIIIANKADLGVQSTTSHVMLNSLERQCDAETSSARRIISLSTLTKQGFVELKQQIKRFVGEKSIEDTEFITNSRQQDCLAKSRESLEQALLAAKIREHQDLISIDVKSALLHLDEITGEVITDDILNNIFDNFCIGK
ncbi:MAG: tRNA uridine-5-carboxymethylaminomethyl(34) synthesis GTPase MnmE [Candidatus Gastranaerophilaceae bacterium]